MANKDLSPPTPAVRRRMRATPQRNTSAELAVRRLLHSHGYRYRVNLSPIAGLRSRADIVFTKHKIAIYIDGCFWHACPLHASWPKKNPQFWKSKIQENIRRDHRVQQELINSGWTVLRFWEHESPQLVVTRIENELARAVSGR